MGAKDLPEAHSRRDVAAWLTAAALWPVAARAQAPVLTPDPSILPPLITVQAAEDEAARMTVPVMLNGNETLATCLLP